MERNTLIKMPLNNGKFVDITLSYARLYKVKAIDQEAYETWFTLEEKGPKDDFDIIKYLHVAYLCANYDKDDCIKDFESFLELVPYDRLVIFALYNKLKGYDAKKKSASETHSDTEEEQQDK